MRRVFGVACAVSVVLALPACGPGPGKLAVATEPGANNVRLVIWNPGPDAVRLLITLNDRILFDERVEPKREAPAIAATRWTTLASRRYRVDVLDRLSGRTATAKFRLRELAYVDVNVLPDGIAVFTSEDSGRRTAR